MKIQLKKAQDFEQNSYVLPANVSPKAQFREASHLYLLDCRYRNLAPTTIDFYKFHLQAFEHFMNHFNLELNTLVPTDLSQRMIHYMLDRKLTANTINGRIRTCQGFFKLLFQDKILDTNLAYDLKVIKAQNQMIFTSHRSPFSFTSISLTNRSNNSRSSLSNEASVSFTFRFNTTTNQPRRIIRASRPLKSTMTSDV